MQTNKDLVLLFFKPKKRERHLDSSHECEVNWEPLDTPVTHRVPPVTEGTPKCRLTIPIFTSQFWVWVHQTRKTISFGRHRTQSGQFCEFHEVNRETKALQLHSVIDNQTLVQTFVQIVQWGGGGWVGQHRPKLHSRASQIRSFSWFAWFDQKSFHRTFWVKIVKIGLFIGFLGRAWYFHASSKNLFISLHFCICGKNIYCLFYN